MSDLRIDVADLLTHPGARRPLRRPVSADDLATRAARVEEPVELDLVLERVPDGIVARGVLRARWSGDCVICLRGLEDDVEVAVGELFEDQPIDGETYQLLGHVIDLDQLVRDAVLLELPLAPTCATTGGAACRPAALPDERDDTDDGDASPVDPRWAALSDLDL
jgi:DUF177 domain-containing protein